MAGKVCTDIEALYAVRGAIAEFSVSFQEAQSGLSQCFEQMNYQIDDYQKRLKSEREDYTEEKRSIDRNIENCEERKAEIERKRENSKSGSTDSFVCGCGVRTMLRVYGDTTTCKSCGGTMHRVYTGNDYNKFNAEAYQLEQKIVQLKKKSAELDRRIKELDEKEDDVLIRKTAFQNQQASILALLSFESGEDPETATAFIDKALASLGEYNSTSFSTDLVSSTDGTKKKESEVSFDNTALSNNYGLLDRDDPRDLPITQYGFDKDSNGDLIYDTPLQTQHWLCSKQGKERANFRGTCGLCSCANIIRLSGVHMSEGDIIDYASTTHAPNSVNMLCEVGNMIPSANGGTSPEDRKTILEHFGISSGIYRIEKNADGSISNNNIENIGQYVSEGRGVILSVHAYDLWYDRPNTINDFHAVTVTSVKKTQDGQILGFYLHDTGRGETNYYSAERLRRALTGSPMNVTHQIIR